MHQYYSEKETFYSILCASKNLMQLFSFLFLAEGPCIDFLWGDANDLGSLEHYKISIIIILIPIQVFEDTKSKLSCEIEINCTL